MARQAFPVVKGKRLRATRVGHCGLPLAGESSTIVTKGFITVGLTKVTKDAEDLESTNAEGEVCVADRTPPELKWWEVVLTLCDVDVELLSFFTDDPVVLDYAQRPVGFRSSKKVKVNGGAALEWWTGVGGADCDVPTDDSALEEGASAENFGYFLTPWIKEATIGDMEIGASVMNMTLTGITGPPTRWGKGPYDVVAQDAANTPGRLLTPMGHEHLHVQRTSIAPPAVTDGAVALEMPSPYYAPVPTP